MTDVDCKTLAAELAGALGEGWAVGKSPNPQGAYLTNPDGRQLYVWQDYRQRHARRVTIQGCYPGGWHCAPREPVEISVRASRGGPAIAVDVRRRLLPQYEIDLVAARRKHAEMVEGECRRDQVAAAIAAVSGKGARVAAGCNGKAEVTLPGIFQRADISPDGSEVSLKLPWLPADAALRVLDALYRPGGPIGQLAGAERACEPAERPTRATGQLAGARSKERSRGRLARLRQTGQGTLFGALTSGNKKP
jgi:hypothetical protein